MKNMLVFMRRGTKEQDDLLVATFPLVYENHKIGVPYSGKFKEIFNSDSTEFGGDGNTNPRSKSSKKNPCDDREDSIRILVPPMQFLFSSVHGQKKKQRLEKRRKRQHLQRKRARKKQTRKKHR